MDKKISVIIPYYEAFPEKREILERCVKSLEGHNEIIVVWNDRMGYSPAINRGLAIAQGDFLVVINDDVIQRSGSLLDLIDEEAVTAPLFNGQRPGFHGSAFCLPRWAYEKIGPMFEGYDTSYFDDDDYVNKILLAKIPMRNKPDVEFDHPKGGTTLESLDNHRGFFKANEGLFKERWGDLPAHTIQHFRQKGHFQRVPKDARHLIEDEVSN